MKINKILASLVLALALVLAPASILAPAAQAQSGQYPVSLTMGTAVSASVDAGQRYFTLLVSAGNVTTFQFTSVSPIQAGSVLVAFQQDDTGSRTIGLATNIKGTLTFNSTANSVTLARFTYDVVSQDWFVETIGHN